MRRRYVLLLGAMLVTLLTLAACGESSVPAASGTAATSARTAACNGVTTVNQVLTSLSNINSSTTVGDVKAAQQKITNALDAIESRIPSTSADILGQIREANDQLAAKVEPYPDDMPIGQTSARVQDLKATVTTALGATTLLAATLQCSS